MAYETKDNTGSLWKNDRKEKDTHPDYTGSVRINGHDMWISAWLKESNGKRFMSLAFKPKDGTSARPGQAEAKAAQDAFGPPETPAVKTRGFDPDDQIPF